MVEGYNWAKRRMGAVCIVLKYDESTGTPYISYYNNTSSTLPGYPFTPYGKAPGLGPATILDGIYVIQKEQYLGAPGFLVKTSEQNSDVDAIYMNVNDGTYRPSDDDDDIMASEIYIHYRTKELGKEKKPWSLGCINVGEGHSPNSGSYKLFTDDLASCSSGRMVVDRHLAKSALINQVYHNADAVREMTLYSTIKASYIDTYTCGAYICKKNVDKEIRVCKTPDDNGMRMPDTKVPLLTFLEKFDKKWGFYRHSLFPSL